MVQATGKVFRLANTQLQHNGFLAAFTYGILEALERERVVWTGAFRKQEITNYLEKKK